MQKMVARGPMPPASEPAAEAWWRPLAPMAPRLDPIALLQAEDADRFGWLVPHRYACMAASPFAFCRGAATVTAADLAAFPHSGVAVQLCGDAHLLNLGVQLAPDRTAVFDLLTFDQTLRGPFEWDLRRFLASLVLAGRQLGLAPERQERLARRACRAYRKTILRLLALPYQQLWSLRLDLDRCIADQDPGPFRERLRALSRQARQPQSRQALRQLCEHDTAGGLRFRHDPPLLWSLREGPPEPSADHSLPWRQLAAPMLERYVRSLRDDARQLLRRYRLLDAAVVAVGAGGLGPRGAIGLLQGPGGPDDLLLLQCQQAGRSPLEPWLEPSPHRHHGQRVVCGQRLLQSVSDPCLGWTTSASGVHLYWRHWRDWSWGASLEGLDGDGLEQQARLCAWVLARAHACSGDPQALAAALAAGKPIDRALAQVALVSADRTEADHRQLLAALASGRLPSDAAVRS